MYKDYSNDKHMAYLTHIGLQLVSSSIKAPPRGECDIAAGWGVGVGSMMYSGGCIDIESLYM